jgi:hypothetical protein
MSAEGKTAKPTTDKFSWAVFVAGSSARINGAPEIDCG